MAVAQPGRLRAELSRWSPSLRVGIAIVLSVVLLGLLAPWLTPYDPLRQDYSSALSAPRSVRIA